MGPREVGGGGCGDSRVTQPQRAAGWPPPTLILSPPPCKERLQVLKLSVDLNSSLASSESVPQMGRRRFRKLLVSWPGYWILGWSCLLKFPPSSRPTMSGWQLGEHEAHEYGLPGQEPGMNLDCISDLDAGSQAILSFSLLLSEMWATETSLLVSVRIKQEHIPVVFIILIISVGRRGVRPGRCKPLRKTSLVTQWLRIHLPT